MKSRNVRKLVVVADDYGIGPNTSAGILEAACCGAVTASVMLVNSPHAPADVDLWRARGKPMELGWHPNLTLDSPVVPASRVPSLTQPDGRFWQLGAFLKRWLMGKVKADEVKLEFEAQLCRFEELVGHLPNVVNTHQHVGVFAPVGKVLLDVLEARNHRPFVRVVREPWLTQWHVQGARLKRRVLSYHGSRAAREQLSRGFPGCDWLAGVTDPAHVKKADFFRRWLKAMPGRSVELMCHPGYLDPTLLGRDCELGDGLMERRVDELRHLRDPEFQECIREAGFVSLAPTDFVRSLSHDERAA